MDFVLCGGRPDGSALSGLPKPFALCLFVRISLSSPALHYNKEMAATAKYCDSHFYPIRISLFFTSFLPDIFPQQEKGSAVTLMSDRHSSTSHLQGESTPARIQKTNAMPGNPDTCFPLLRLCIGATTYVSIQKNKVTAHENTGKPHTVKNSIICLLILSPITMSYFKEKP